MKKLIFLDNDFEDTAQKDSRNAQRALTWTGLPDEYIKSMEIISSFARMDKQEAYKMVFSGNYLVCTWSMYTASHYNSLGQIIHFLRAGGSAGVQGIIYFDTSSNLPQALRYEINAETKGVLDILQAIETNYILTNKDGECVRMRVDLKGNDNPYFRFEQVNLSELIGYERLTA